MINISVNGQITEIPASWNELTRVQLLAIAAIIGERLPEWEFKLRAFFAITGWKLNDLSVIINRKSHQITAWQFVELCKTVSFIVTETQKKDERIIAINPKLTKNIIPQFRCRLRKYHGPADRLFNLSFGEYLVADNYFSRYMETRDEMFLDKLVATLYRRRDRNYDPQSSLYRGDIREPFNSYTVETRAKRLTKLPKSVKNAVLLYFHGCKSHLADVFTEVFAPGGGTPSRFGSMSLVDALTNGDVTKSETVRSQYLYDVLVHLENTAKTHREMKERANNAK